MSWAASPGVLPRWVSSVTDSSATAQPWKDLRVNWLLHVLLENGSLAADVLLTRCQLSRDIHGATAPADIHH